MSRVSVIRVEIFPAYSEVTLNFDLAIMTLESSVYVPYAKLPELDKQILPGKPVAAVGWGITELGGTSPKLLMTSLVTITFDDCKQSNPNWVITENMFCAIGTESTTCRGDSGSGIYSVDGGKPDKLIGLVSWGDKSCQTSPTRPGGFVDLTNTHLRRWLNLIIV